MSLRKKKTELCTLIFWKMNSQSESAHHSSQAIFRPKFLTLVKAGIPKQQIIQDSMAGIIVGIVALPLAIAFAVASGVAPEKGIMTAIIAGFIISALGGSRVQIGGPTGAFIVIVYDIVVNYGLTGLMISTMMAGVMLVLFGLLKLGSLLKFFPRPLVVGFTSGIAVVILTSQIKDALGIPVENLPGDFLEKIKMLSHHLSGVNLTSVILTAATLLIIITTRKISKKIPGSFIAIVLLTLIVQIFHANAITLESAFPVMQPGFNLEIPDFQSIDIRAYIRPAIAIALLGSIESLLSAMVGDGMIGGNHRSNTELIAQGIANIVTPIFGGIPATGALARTATNVNSGGRTPIAGIVHAITLLLIFLFLGKLAGMIPMAVLAGILIMVAYNMSEWRSFVSILKGSPFDIIILLSTFLLTVLVDLTVAIEIGILLSSLLFMKRMADTGTQSLDSAVDSDVIEDYSALPHGVKVFEISGPFFFGSAKQYAETMTSTGIGGKVLIIRLRHVPFIDGTGLHNFKYAIKSLKQSGIKVVLSGVNPAVRKELDRSGISSLIGEPRICDQFDQAVICSKKLLLKEKVN